MKKKSPCRVQSNHGKKSETTTRKIVEQTNVGFVSISLLERSSTLGFGMRELVVRVF